MSSDISDQNKPSSPLSNPVFRAIWIASVASNVGTWIQDIGAAWLMASLAPSPFMVALVQAAATAPMFFLALPSGALADIVDRRILLLIAQLWMLTAAASLAVLTYLDLVTPSALLAITFALGVGFALNSTAWQAIVPDLVPPEQLDDAVTLSGIGINVARAIGPAIGGVIVAKGGPEAAFLLNSVSFLAVVVVIYRWKPSHQETTARKESLLGAMLLGARYVQYTQPFQAVLVRTFAFIFFGSALWAHLPLVAKEQLGTEAGGYGLLLGMIGVGAVATAFFLPRLRKSMSTHLLAVYSTIGMAIALGSIGFIESLAVMSIILLPIGAFWVAILSSLNVSAQTSIAPWVKARALSVYLIVFFGSMSMGAVCWGAIASQLGIQNSLLIAAVGMVVAQLLTIKFRLDTVDKSDLLPSLHWPALPVKGEGTVDGPVILSVEYVIEPSNKKQFLELMQILRQSRYKTGAYQWYLACDSDDLSLWTEVFFVASWEEHERQHHRVSVEDAKLQLELAGIHAGEEPPTVTHWLVNSV